MALTARQSSAKNFVQVPKFSAKETHSKKMLIENLWLGAF